MSTKSIVIAGSLAQKPGRGGHTWVFLQYVLGFRKLGWDVLFLDRLDTDMIAAETADESGAPVPIEQSWNVLYIQDVMEAFGLSDSYALLCGSAGDAAPGGEGRGRRTIGLSREEILARVSRSAALINVMGFLTDGEILAAAPMRVFLDIDPGFGQMWQALGLHDTFRGHDAFVTIAGNIGRDDCAIPTCGLDWISTPQPIVLDEWPAVNGARRRSAITSVASWRGAYAPIEYAGTTYTLRAHEFRKFAALPSMAAGPFELALDIHPADAKDIDLLGRHGWTLVDPRAVAGDPWTYRDYIQQSAAELMVAKGMYVQTRSGWFSDRSICYLASGRPVIAQDTGLRDLLPTGDGLRLFTTLEEAADAAGAVARDYDRHARAARHLAEAHFDSSRVLGALVRALDLE